MGDIETFLPIHIWDIALQHFAAKIRAYFMGNKFITCPDRKEHFGLVKAFLGVGLLAFISFSPQGVRAQDGGAMPEININSLNAIPPKPVYFPDEKIKAQKKKQTHSLDKIEPAAIGDSSNLGTIMLDPNPAYPEQSAIIRLRKLKEEESRKAARTDAAVIGSLDEPLSAMPESPVFEPQAAWLVGPTAASKLSDADQKGCLALNQFSNDFIVGIHASHNQILGITIDTRQHVFKPDTVYPIAMSLGPDSFALMGLASDQSTVAISLDDVPAFGYKVKQVGAMRFVIGATPMYFSTTGLANGLKRLKNCLNERGAETLKVQNSTSGEPIVQAIPANADVYAPDYAPETIKQMKVKRAGKRVPVALAVTELIPSGYRFIIERGVDPMTKISWKPGPLWIDVLVHALAPQKIYVHLKDNIVRVSHTPPAQKKDELPPELEDKFAANIDSDELRHAKQEEGEVAGALNPMTYTETREWTAKKDESLSKILRQWSSEAGVKLVLDMDEDYTLKEPYVYDGTFEDAVSTLMGRFGNGKNGPKSMFRSTVYDDVTRRTDPALLASMDSRSRLTRYSDMMGKPVPQLEKLGKFPGKNYNAQPLSPAASNKTWRGLEGANLKDVLGNWAQDAGAKLIWHMDQMMELKESVKIQGSFTDAVSGVLQQYSKDGLRPVAQLNNDPDTHLQTLIIRLAGKPKAQSIANRNELSKEELAEIKKEEK